MLNDRMKFQQIADPVFQGQYPPRGLYQALAVAAMCVQEQPSMRPLMGDVVTALSYLSSQPNKPENQQRPNTYRLTATSTPRRVRRDGEKKLRWRSESDQLRRLK